MIYPLNPLKTPSKYMIFKLAIFLGNYDFTNLKLAATNLPILLPDRAPAV
jgi:hypothetical protein